MAPPESPLVSIVVPCFNHQDYLEETLASVYAQTLADWELILINDGSTDGTAAILEAQARRADPRIMVHSTPNRGVSRARNLGISLASGRFIQFLDSDDLLLPNSLEAKVEALESGSGDVAYGDFQYLIPNGAGGFVKGDIQIRNLADFDPDVETAIMQGFWVPPAGLLYRKTLVDKVGGFDLGYPICQDGRFMFDAARSGARWSRVEGIYTLYRIHSEGNSKKDTSAFLGWCFAETRHVEDIWTQTGKPLTKVRRQALLNRYYWLASNFFEHDRDLFPVVVEQIRKHDPELIPLTPPKMKLFSRLVGYPKAEAVALVWRRTKRFFGLKA